MAATIGQFRPKSQVIVTGLCSHLPDHLEPELVAEPRNPLQLRQREGYLLLIHLRVVEDREGVDAHLQEQLEQAAEGLG